MPQSELILRPMCPIDWTGSMEYYYARESKRHILARVEEELLLARGRPKEEKEDKKWISRTHQYSSIQQQSLWFTTHSQLCVSIAQLN